MNVNTSNVLSDLALPIWGQPMHSGAHWGIPPVVVIIENENEKTKKQDPKTQRTQRDASAQTDSFAFQPSDAWVQTESEPIRRSDVYVQTDPVAPEPTQRSDAYVQTESEPIRRSNVYVQTDPVAPEPTQRSDAHVQTDFVFTQAPAKVVSNREQRQSRRNKIRENATRSSRFSSDADDRAQKRKEKGRKEAEERRRASRAAAMTAARTKLPPQRDGGQGVADAQPEQRPPFIFNAQPGTANKASATKKAAATKKATQAAQKAWGTTSAEWRYVHAPARPTASRARAAPATRRRKRTPVVDEVSRVLENEELRRPWMP
jgi:hypothetical protein